MVKWVIMIPVRAERKEDIGDIHMLNRLAFGQEDEAVLVQRIRESLGFIPELSLVAVLSMAPMAVLPEFQNSGIGSQLVRIGLKKCRDLGHTIVVVIGHPQCYPQFGFVPARKKGLGLDFSVPDESFMVCELAPDALEGINGMVKYPPEFADVI
jgi:putative acetyltransferase